MIRRPPRSTRTDTLFPYTTLFRSSSFPDRRPTLASSPRLVGIASAGFPPPASLLPAVLPADHPEPPWRVSLSHRRRLAGLFSTVLSSRLRSVKTHADEAIAWLPAKGSDRKSTRLNSSH